jgi:hypothetical protein
MDFDKKKQKKFERGQQEHRRPWDAAHIDARREMQRELCDLYNYAELMGDEMMKVRIQMGCRDIWNELEDMGDYRRPRIVLMTS